MRRSETTSKKVASKAAKALHDPKASKREKSLAGSALTQKEPKVARLSKLERFWAALTEYYAACAALNQKKPKRKAKEKAPKNQPVTPTYQPPMRQVEVIKPKRKEREPEPGSPDGDEE